MVVIDDFNFVNTFTETYFKSLKTNIGRDAHNWFLLACAHWLQYPSVPTSSNRLGIVMDRTVPLKNSYVEALTLNVTVFGGRAFSEIIMVNEVIRVG